MLRCTNVINGDGEAHRCVRVWGHPGWHQGEGTPAWVAPREGFEPRSGAGVHLVSDRAVCPDCHAEVSYSRGRNGLVALDRHLADGADCPGGWDPFNVGGAL